MLYEKQGIIVNYTEDPFAVIVITPMMQRAHMLKTSSDIVFVDTTSACDPENHAITFMLAPCAAGAVPLAIIITKGIIMIIIIKVVYLINTLIVALTVY